MKIGNRFRTRLRLLSLTSVLLTVLALALPLIYSSQQTVATEREQHRSVLVKLLAQEADIIFEKYQVRLEREAEKIATLTETEPDRIISYLQNIRKDYPDFHNLFLWPFPDGDQAPDSVLAAWVQDVSQKAIATERNQFFSRGNKLFLAVPAGNGQALTAYINSKESELQSRLQQIIEGETGRVFLLDTNGNYLFHSDPALIGTYLSDTAKDTDVDAITSASYSQYTMQKNGKELDFYFVPVPHRQMVAGFSISHNEETALLRDLWLTGLSLSVLVIFFSIYYSGKISHNMTDSVDELTTQIDRYSRGLKQDAFSYHDKAPEEINLMVNTLNQMQTQIKTGYLSLISSLSLALEARDTQTQGHSLRVARFSYLLACQMGLSSQLKQEVWEASLLHDIGKLSVSDSILHKPGSLSDSEFAQVKTHPRLGAEVVAHIPELGHLAPLIESHHEHYNGKGYPGGKSGTEIPLAARIMAVADAFEAMTSDRPYRKALSRSEARYRLEKGSGTQFDPEVVSTALRVFPQLSEGQCEFSPQYRRRNFTFTNLHRASREICNLCYKFNPTCPYGQENTGWLPDLNRGDLPVSKVHFKKNIMESLMLDPRQEFKQVKIQSELRFDPLTGNSSRVAHFGNWKTVTPDLNHLDTEENHRNCPFCPGNIDRRTPHFPQGYFFSSPQAGEATVIPNLMPYEKHSALVIISKRHLIPINKLAPVLIADALQVAVMYIRRIREIDVNTPYSLIGWNYMPPSGGSQVHPHLQVFTGINPGNLYRQELEACQRYRREKGGSYWQDLVQTEKELKERYLGNSGSWEWITAFAPLGMAGDIMAVHKDDLAEMGYRDLLDLAEGMLKIFRYLDGQGIYSFNLGLFPPPKADPAFATHLRLIPRVTINPRLEVPDANVFQMVFQEPICVIRPEELAESIPWK